MIERVGANSVASVIARGNENSEKYDRETYESHAIRKRTFTNENVIWLVWPGLNSPDSGLNKFFLEGSASAPGAMDSIPRQGTCYIFHGPTAIAGYTPEQLIKAMDQLLEDARLIIKNNPGKKICMYGFSGGTAPATYVANQIGLERGEAIDKLILAAGGDSMAYGLFRTYATKELAKSYLDRGITVEEFHDAIKPYTQMHNIKALPAGRNLLVHAGTDDHVVEMDMAHGTNEFVRRLQRAGKDPVYTVHQNRNHASLVLSLMAQERLGLDPFGLRTPQSVWEQDSTLQDPVLMAKVKDELGRFKRDELQDIAEYLTMRSGNGIAESEMRSMFSGIERAIVRSLIELDVCRFVSSPDAQTPGILTSTEERNIPSFNRMRRRFKAVDNLSRVSKTLQKLDAMASEVEKTPLQQTVDVVEEIKKLGLPGEAYCVVIDGAMAVSSDEHLTIVARNDLYESLRESDWTAHGEYFGKGNYRIYPDFHGEDFSSLSKNKGMVDGIPVVNRVVKVEDGTEEMFTLERAA